MRKPNRIPTQHQRRKMMVDMAGETTIPDLSSVSFADAHENYTQQVVAGTLRQLRVPKIKAERLAAIHQGCPRVRLEKIVRMEGLG